MRVLVAEDYPPIRKAVAKGLREAGFAVDVTGDGEEALWYATSNDYDVVVLDLMLPGVDGLTILKRLRSEGRATHVLILTAKDTVPDRVLGLDLGADDYLVKPFAFAELLARLRALQRRSATMSPVELTCADLVLDLARHRVTRADKEIVLTPKEFSLLEHLLRQQGDVVTKTSIIEHVWDMHFDSFSNVVEVLVNRLRNKIDAPFDKPLIHTVRGVGYVLHA